MTYSSSRLFLRILLRNREVYALKILTLAIAFASATLVILFSLNEFNFDRYHHDANALFRVLERNEAEHHFGNRLSGKIPFDVYNNLASQPYDSLIVARVNIMKELSVLGDSGNVYDRTVHAADQRITHILRFDVLEGSLDIFHKTKRSAIMSASLAKSLFGTASAIGKSIRVLSVNDTLEVSIAATYEDWPKNSHEDFNLFLSFDKNAIESLGFNAMQTGVYGKAINGEITAISQNLQSKSDDKERSYSLQPLTEIYFGPRVLGEDARHGDSYSVMILISVTGFILLLGLTSYVNLTTLTLPYRAKELAVRKLAGSNPFNLFVTFFKESLIVVTTSALLGLLLLALTNDVIQPMLAIDFLELAGARDLTLIAVIGGILLSLIVAPLVLTFKFIKASPNRLLSTERITFPKLKKTITVLQLGISIFLIVSSMVIKRQVNYSLLKEPGRNYEQIVYLNYPDDLTAEGLASTRSGWRAHHPNIVDAIALSQLPDRVSSKEVNSPFYSIAVDAYFPGFFELNMLNGNWFKPNTEDSYVVLNERGMKALTGDSTVTVIGVIDDMNSQFNQPDKPLKFKPAKTSDNNYLCVRILEVDIRRTINYLSNYFNGARVYLLNKRFEEWLRQQDRLNTLSEFLGIISAILSCCAIYGLSISVVRDKLNQIAVRKIYGADTKSITIFLTRQFAKEIFVAIVVFGPITYIFATEFLRNFVYSTHLQWSDLIFPIAYCVLVILMLSGFQARSLSRKDLSSALKE